MQPPRWTTALSIAVLALLGASLLGFWWPGAVAAARAQGAPSPTAGPPPAPVAPKPAVQAGIPLLQANTTLVDVPVLVLDKSGQPMDMLDRSDFRIFDDGLAQKVVGFDNLPRPLSLAIVVDTNEYAAIGQAKRSAVLIADMVVGIKGRASVFVAGPQPRQVLGFTDNTQQLIHTLQHLSKSPTAALGKGSIVEPLNLAMLDLQRQPEGRTRAALVISRQSGRSGLGAEALMESGMNQAIPIFRIAPNHPAGMPNYVNPDTPAQRGVGQGSQRVIAPPAPVDSRGNPTSGNGTASLNLGPLLGAATSLAGKVIDAHHLDFVYATGGMTYKPGNDNQFDQRLSLIGDELRAIYHLYYSPTDLGPQLAMHAITVKLTVPATASVGRLTYRRTYVGLQPH